MAMVDLSTLYKVNAKGRVYYYAWRGKGAPRLLCKPGSPEFVAEYAAALETRKQGDKSRLSGLVARYKGSEDYLELSDKTKEAWRPWLDRIQIYFGELRLEQFDRPQMTPMIRKWRDAYKATPRAADMALQAFSRLLSFGQEEGKLGMNVVTKIPRLYSVDRSGIIWTDDDLLELAKHASKEVMWAAKLAIYTGLRQGDLLRLSWSHVSELAIEVRTGKTGATALIPMHAKLAALLAEIPKRSPVILTNSDGRPWRGGFGSSWNKTIIKAGINKHFHDLRGTAATVLYLADLSIREIAGIMAWSEKRVEAIIDRYVKRDELLRDRIRRMDENARRTESEKLSAKPPA